MSYKFLDESDVHVQIDNIMQSAWAKPKKTINALKKKCERETQKTAYYCHTLGVFLVQLGNRKSAIAYFQKAITKKPDFVEATYALKILNQKIPQASPLYAWNMAKKNAQKRNYKTAKKYLNECQQNKFLTKEMIVTEGLFQSMLKQPSFAQWVNTLPSAKEKNQGIHVVRMNNDPLYELEKKSGSTDALLLSYKKLKQKIRKSKNHYNLLNEWLRKLRAYNSKDLVIFSIYYAVQDKKLQKLLNLNDWKRFRRSVYEVNHVPSRWWKKWEK